jgi:hypothetical protein
VGFLVAFFFIVLFSLGLDLLAALPGFFIAAIRVPPLWVAAAGRASELIHLVSSTERIIEICYVRIKRLMIEFRKKF